MIITQETNKQVVQSHDFEAVDCTIDAEDMRYVASLLRNNYSNPTLAVVREITANALDANSEAGQTRSIEVTIPSRMNPHFLVRDFGGGLSQDEVFNLYSKYGKSTKRNSNNYIGAFGIGKFAPLSYGNNFTCVSYNGGLKTSYNVFVNEDDDTRIVKLAEVATNEPSGLSIEVAVADDDVDSFRDVVKRFFRFFKEDEMPKFIGVGEDEKFLEEFEILMESNEGNWFIIEDKRHYYDRNHHSAHAVMGRVHYPLDPDAMNFDKFIDDDDEKQKNFAYQLNQLINQDNVYIRFDIGQLKLHHSRESLEYSKQTQKQIFETLSKVFSEIQEIAKEKLGDAEDLWDAKVKYAQVVNALPHTLKSIFENTFEWEGNKITSPSIDRDYKHQDDLIITHYWKEDDADATDGFKCRSQKQTRVIPTDKTSLLIQDIRSNHGNALRARTLFSKDENLENVYVVYPSDASGEEYLFAEDGMNFGKINKERFQYTSKVDKAKLQAKGRAVSGESRASVPLFELDTTGTNKYKRTNSSYWLNNQENIDELEEGEQELIYVPIANYKVVDINKSGQEESVSLDSLLRDVSGIKSIQKSLHKGDDEDFQFPLVLGVRRNDCKKLAKSRWSSWDDYKKTFAKQYLVDHKDKVEDSEKAMAFKENQYNLDHYRCLDTLLENSKFHKILEKKITDKNHLWNEVIGEFKLMKDCDDPELTTIFRMVNFLKNVDEEWVKENIPSNYDANEFDNKCKKLVEQYPLCVNIAKEIYNWQNMEENNLGKNLVDYIQLVDNCPDNLV